MARMYSRKKGKSGSKKPMVKEARWVKYKPEEIEEIIVKLAKKGLQSSQIGLTLRDEYGIPLSRMFTKTKIVRIMKKHNIYPDYPEDMLNLLRTAANLRSHMEKNKRDYTSKHGLELTESKIRRLAKYYKRRKALPPDWKYSPAQAKLLMK
jgi:small subunit ribosomal protein S15